RLPRRSVHEDAGGSAGPGPRQPREVRARARRAAREGRRSLRIRGLAAADLGRIAEIDRSESIRTTYVYERGRLRAVANVHEAPRWSDEYVAKLVAQLEPKLGDGGVFLGAFDGVVLAGVGVLGGRFLGLSRNQLEVAFLHVSRAYRRRGIARRLMDEL